MSEDVTALIIVYVGIAVALFVGALIFFVPTFIAFIRGLKHKWIIFLINLLGSSVFGIGWVIALVWAIIPEPFDSIMDKIFRKKVPDSQNTTSCNTATQQSQNTDSSSPNFCPNCGTKLSEKKPFCSNCGCSLK